MRDAESTEELSDEQALLLARSFEARRNPFSDQWKDLVHHGRPLLMELACYENSILSKETIQRFGDGASIRASHWNGVDLETKEGVALAKTMVSKFRPVHLWVSCECGPYSPLQRVNQRNPDQCRRLEEKRDRARLQYHGAIEVCKHARTLGVEIHFELSERCEAWNLPLLIDFLKEFGLEKVTCHGCAVGLRTLDRKSSLCKGWTIATRNQQLLQHLSLKCQKNHPKARCEAGQAAHTARYTPAFARRVVNCLSENEAWSHVLQELQGYGNEVLVGELVDEPEGAEIEGITAAEKHDIERKIQHIHKNTGHGSMKSLIAALEARGVADQVLQVARAWKCPACQERKRVDPRRFATLETLAPKWERIQIDTAAWTHPVTHVKSQIMMIIDEGSRFRLGRVLFDHPTKTPTWTDMRQVYEESWRMMIGNPHTVRVDPAGAWRSDAANQYFSERGIMLEPIPAEAHWQIGLVEGCIKTMKGIMTQLAQDFPETTTSELLAQAVWASNNQDNHRGFSPFQHALGKAPDEHGRMFETDDQKPIHPELMHDGGFSDDVKILTAAETAFLQEQAQRRLERASRMGPRASHQYVPDDLVYYWRKQVAGRREVISFRGGKFLGPARVIATDTRREPDGGLRPASVIWIHRGGRLLRAAPEQLRHASQREQWIEELKGPVELPWTITSLASSGVRRGYIDISHDIPEEDVWMESHDVPPEEPNLDDDIPQKRMRVKGPGIWASANPVSGQQEQSRTVNPGSGQQDGSGTLASANPVSGQQEKSRTVNPGSGQRDDKRSSPFDTGSGASGSRRRLHSPKDDDLFVEDMSVVQIEIPLPESNRGWKRFSGNPEAFMCSKLKRKQVEVREKNLTEKEAQAFSEAKAKEVRNFLAAECFQLCKDQKPKESDVVGMRWLLTWKGQDTGNSDGEKRPKARAIVLGYQDPKYESRETSAPTPTKAGRQLFLQFAAWRRFRVAKGDISGAFLQGLDMDEELWVRPLPEITKELKVPPGTPMLLKKAAYGLVQAPLHWFRSVCAFLGEIGYVQLQTEKCCWIFKDQHGVVRSIVHGHVDDFMLAGSDGCEIHAGLMKRLQERFKWGEWELGSFTQCGIRMIQKNDCSFEIDQQKFIEDLEEIPITRDRSKMLEDNTTEKEKSLLRGVLGSLSWLCGQTCFLYSVDVGFLITCIPVSKVSDIVKTNQLVRAVQKWKHLRYRIHSFQPHENLEMVCWADAAWANRPNGKDSTAGVFIGMSNASLREGKEADVSPVFWRASKVERVCRSPACAECMAALDGEDDLVFLRFLWAEMQGFSVDPRYPSLGARKVPGMLITDAKNLFDKLHRPAVIVKGAEKRSTIEAISLQEHLISSDTEIRWVNGDSMIANSLTKPSEKHQFFLFINLGFRWKITYDELMRSAKVRKQQGLEPLQSSTSSTPQNHQQPHQQPLTYHQHLQEMYDDDDVCFCVRDP